MQQSSLVDTLPELNKQYSRLERPESEIYSEIESFLVNKNNEIKNLLLKEQVLKECFDSFHI
jgi:hypothetical protein